MRYSISTANIDDKATLYDLRNDDLIVLDEVNNEVCVSHDILEDIGLIKNTVWIAFSYSEPPPPVEKGLFLLYSLQYLLSNTEYYLIQNLSDWLVNNELCHIIAGCF